MVISRVVNPLVQEISGGQLLILLCLKLPYIPPIAPRILLPINRLLTIRSFVQRERYLPDAEAPYPKIFRYILDDKRAKSTVRIHGQRQREQYKRRLPGGCRLDQRRPGGAIQQFPGVVISSNEHNPQDEKVRTGQI